MSINIERCSRCGEPNIKTGRQKRSAWRRPAFGGGPNQRTVSEEYRCEKCGFVDWAESSVEDGAPGEGD